MFAGRYFAQRYFAPRYFPQVGDVIVVVGAPIIEFAIDFKKTQTLTCNFRKTQTLTYDFKKTHTVTVDFGE